MREACLVRTIVGRPVRNASATAAQGRRRSEAEGTPGPFPHYCTFKEGPDRLRILAASQQASSMSVSATATSLCAIRLQHWAPRFDIKAIRHALHATIPLWRFRSRLYRDRETTPPLKESVPSHRFLSALAESCSAQNHVRVFYLFSEDDVIVLEPYLRDSSSPARAVQRPHFVPGYELDSPSPITNSRV